MTTNPITALRALDAHTADCDLTDAYRAACTHDTISAITRDLLIDPDSMNDDFSNYFDIYPAIDDATINTIRDLINAALESDNDTIITDLSMLLLDHSLCPMHRIDYAICFDDDDDECATIRRFFRSHDT